MRHWLPMTPAQVELLTRDGCGICRRVHDRLAELAAELGFELSSTDVDHAAEAGNPALRAEFGKRSPNSARSAGLPALRAEFGDRLPVVLLNGREHSYWDIDEARLRADIAKL